MNGVRVALDTNTAVHYLNGIQAVVDRLQAETAVALPVTVAGELLYGALNSSQRAANYSRYEQFIANTVLLPVDLDAARRYADLRLALRQAGNPIPENDLWIAATCLRYSLVLATDDAHFVVCPGLVVENWVRASAP
jgi:tRNA(fMet)-specific endonuclease VapC